MKLLCNFALCLVVLSTAPAKAAPVNPAENSDATLVLRSKLAILADSQVSGFDIQIQAQGGVLAVSGTVDTEIQRRVIDNILRSVPGARRLELNIQLNPDKSREPTLIRLPAPDRRKDEDIASRVRTALAADSKLSRSSVDVQVSRRMVRLSGAALNDETILRAAHAVRAVPGVLAVDARPLLKAPETAPVPAAARVQFRGLEMSQLSPSETRELQRSLMLAGIYKGTPDGVWNDLTEKALITYQARYNLPITGRLDSATVHSLHLKITTEGRSAELGPRTSRSSQARVRVISDEPFVAVLTASDVRAVQQALENQGFYSGLISGRIDQITRFALKAFQRANNLVITGDIDQPTINALGLRIDISRKHLMQ
jgi:osmotically-inducible protein OsmY/peptidoglycan hydrolase-like protein with peptidoglycan-binding domain